MSWRVAKSLDKLLAQINEKFPNRSKASDGSIGDASHSARESDHNPDANGVVCARDYTHDPANGFDSYAFADELRLAHDPRVKYIISNRRIANPDVQNNAWRPYSGANPHDHHVHVSVKDVKSLYDSEADWNVPMLDGTATGPVVSPEPEEPEVSGKDVQTALNAGGFGPLTVDGDLGGKSRKAIMRAIRKAVS